ncbi:hypothetical protein [Mucilaginibacter kameinonensis]|uniref:hypothetical protein n=1 Tax=Mucilaginibacter kameinonensis TaxID=452286 RepID=UPI000EF7EBB7|nr:hypothetical protein [Mucilaginibacter kameinonensis]
MKPVLKYFVIFALTIFTNFAFAQSGSHGVNSTLNRQNMDLQTGQQTAFSMWTYWNKDDKGTNNPEYNFLVTMLNGTKKEVKSRIYVDDYAHKSYLVYIDQSLSKADTNREQIIYPEQTIEIARDITPSLTKKSSQIAAVSNYYKGIAKDSCWMFRFISGPISAYSLLSEPDGKMFNPKSIVAIQLNNGSIVQYNEENLREMVGDDPDAIESIQWKNYLQAIRRYNRNHK